MSGHGTPVRIDPRAEPRQIVAARRWLTLAVGSLVLAGLLSLLLVIARAPVLSTLVTDPLFFKRCLVVHVDLSLAVWIHAFTAGLLFLVPARGGPSRTARSSIWLAVAGVALLVVAAGAKDAVPVLSNYLPMIDHPLYALGLGLFGAAVAISFLDARLAPGRELPWGPAAIPEAARPGLRAAALSFLLALLTFAAAWLTTSRELPVQAYYENLYWGGGHVLQFASIASMLSLWLVLLTPVLGREPVGRGTSSLLFGVLVAPVLAAPLLAMQGTSLGSYKVGFTRLMQWGIFPVVTVFLALCLRALWVARREGRLVRPLSDLRVAGFAASAALTVAGFVIGALIRGHNTMVPAHYHAAIGAVTVAFMAGTYVLLPALGLPLTTPRQKRLATLQPLLFGAGQLVFALGFAIAGAHGMGRKLYAGEQHIRSAGEWAGLALVGVGGLVAVASGIVFLTLVALAWRARLHAPLAERTAAWNPETESIPSRG